MAFDAAQIRLSDVGMPSDSWHTTSLLSVVSEACSTSPWTLDGTSRWQPAFKRHVAVTSAAARLAERGFDLDGLVRGGFGEQLTGAILARAVQAAVELRRGLDIPQEPSVLGERLLSSAAPSAFPDDLLDAFTFARMGGCAEFTGRTRGWITESERVAELLCWRLPTDDQWRSCDVRSDLSVDAVAVWLRDRFLSTYLSDWSTRSLHLEFRYQLGSDHAPVDEHGMHDREVGVDGLAGVIARRVTGLDASEGDFFPLQEEAIELLNRGRNEEAVALFQGALFTSPNSRRLQNNLAFCLIPSRSKQAMEAFSELVADGFDTELSLANLCTAQIAAGDLDTASVTLRHLESLPRTERSLRLWDLRGGEPSIVTTSSVVDHLREQLAAAAP